jgi:predicted kinase
MGVGAAGVPWLVLVTGAPGSGKTSLGWALSSALRVPFLGRDQVRGGLLATAGMWTGTMAAMPARETAVEAFVELVETAAGLGVSAVVELVVTPDRADALARLEAAARCVVLLLETSAAAERAAARDAASPLIDRPEVLAALGFASAEEYLADPARARVGDEVQTSFHLPTLRVRTDAGYRPALDDIVEWVIDRTGRR